MSNILVVDDSAMCREPIAEVLRRHGYEVRCAADGAEAIGVLSEQRTHLVLLDITMPDVDGLEVLEMIRRKPELKEIPVIVLTDRSDRATASEAAQHGTQAYFLKEHFSLDALLARIDTCLSTPTSSGHSARAKRSS